MVFTHTISAWDEKGEFMKTKVHDAKYYSLMQVGEEFVLLSNSSAAIMEFLSKSHEAYYSDIESKTDIPTSSLYVFIERLEKAGYVKRTRKMNDKTKRIMTTIELLVNPKFHKMKIIR